MLVKLPNWSLRGLKLMLIGVFQHLRQINNYKFNIICVISLEDIEKWLLCPIQVINDNNNKQAGAELGQAQ